jgi:predicted dinucleotide-binding enzyme
MFAHIVPGEGGVAVDVCGDERAKAVVMELAASHDFVPEDKGDLADAGELEPFKWSPRKHRSKSDRRGAAASQLSGKVERLS